MQTPEVSPEEKALLADLEPTLRRAVWNSSAKNGPHDQSGKWCEYPLTFGNRNAAGKYVRVQLQPNDGTTTFLESFSPFGTSHLHTSVALYRVLRALKKRGLLNVSGFDCMELWPPSKQER